MPTYDVYLSDPKQNLFTPRIRTPVFKGVVAESEKAVIKFWDQYQNSSKCPADQKQMSIKEIKEIDQSDNNDY